MTAKSRVFAYALVGLLITTVAVAIFSARDQSLTRIKRTGVIKIGYAVEAPYAFLKPGGELTGAEVEVAKVIAASLGLGRIEWQLAEFGDLIPELEAGRIDAIVAGMFITPERAKRASFSEPTFHVQQGLLVATGNPQQLHSYAQAAAIPQVKIAVISGAVEEDLLKRLGLNPAQVVPVPDALTGRVAVETGQVDGLALSALTIRWMALQDQLGRTEMALPFEQDEFSQNHFLGYGAVVFHQDDCQLRSAWNKALKDFIGTPSHLNLVAPFGFTAAELPGTVTTQEILSQP